MIYETSVVVRAEASEEALAQIKSNVKEVITEGKGEILMEDDWGVKSFAQPTEKGVTKGRYLYVMYKAADGSTNTELERRYRISEDILKFIVVKLGSDEAQKTIIEAYKNPNTSRDADEGKSRLDLEKEKKLFAKRKSCWFSAKKTQPDWKDPSTYGWLVNEFGKISPARVTGLRPRFQRSATVAVKRARVMGLISYMSNRTVR